MRRSKIIRCFFSTHVIAHRIRRLQIRQRCSKTPVFKAPAASSARLREYLRVENIRARSVQHCVAARISLGFYTDAVKFFSHMRFADALRSQGVATYVATSPTR
jgi:hypothetical protein